MRLSKLTAPKSAFHDYPGDEDGARFEITLLTPKQEREISSKAQKVVAREGGGEMVFDTTLAGSLRASMCLTGCESLYLSPGSDKEEKFTGTLKRKLLDEVPGFEAWVLECYGKLREQHEAEQEAERKNLAA
ncbi:hypothetical protein [Solidesulfovibrio sp.]